MKELYTRLRAEMKARKMSITGLTLATGISHKTLCNRIYGHALWKIDEAYDILDVLGQPHEKLAELFPRGGES